MKAVKSRSATVRELLYDKEYDLRLGIAQLEELEENAKMGAMGILNLFIQRAFYVSHVVQVIRLGLIGSGALSPMQAARFVRTKLIEPTDDQGRTFIMDYYEAALNSLSVALYGPDDDQTPGKEGVAVNHSTPTPPPHGDNSTEQQPPSDLALQSLEA